MCFSILNHISYMGGEIYGIYKIHVFFSSKPYILIERKNLKEEFIMAITKVLASSALVIEVENGSYKNGAPTYRKKSFAGVKGNAAVENV